MITTSGNMKIFIIVLIVLLSLSIILSAVTYVIYRMAFYNNEKFTDPINHIPDVDFYKPYINYLKEGILNADNYEYKDYYIQSYDGLTLHGRFYNLNPGAPIILEFHGYKGSGIRDLSGGLKYDKEYGYNIFMVDMRGHGASEGHTISFGIKERRDVLTWSEFVSEEFHLPVILYGVSMGAATVLMASSYDFPMEVKGIIADCPYSSPKEIILKVTKEKGINPNLAYPFIYMGALLFGHFNLASSSAEEEVKKTKYKIYLIHGSEDNFVPLYMSEKIHDANPSLITLSVFEGAPHGFSCYKDIDRYFSELKTFTDSVIK